MGGAVQREGEGTVRAWTEASVGLYGWMPRGPGPRPIGRVPGRPCQEGFEHAIHVQFFAGMMEF